MRYTFRRASLLAVAVGLAVTAGASRALEAGPWPQRPVRFILGFPAGGASDIVGRALAQHLTETWKQQVVVDNRPGATGLIASELAAQAAPDGYTVLLISSSYANNVILKPATSFDPMKDLAPVTKVAVVPNVAVVPPSLPVKNVADLIELAKQKPGSLSYASGGTGTGTHLGTELLRMMAHIDIVHVPYKGTPPALVDLMASRVQLMLAGAPPTLPFIRTGRLKAIGVTSAKRTAALPDVPAIAETLPGYEATTWYGFMVPGGVAPVLVAKLNRDIGAALQAPAVRKALADAGFDPEPSTAAAFAAYLRSEVDKWRKVIQAERVEAG